MLPSTVVPSSNFSLRRNITSPSSLTSAPFYPFTFPRTTSPRYFLAQNDEMIAASLLLCPASALTSTRLVATSSTTSGSHPDGGI